MKRETGISLVIGASGQVGGALMEHIGSTGIGTFVSHPLAGGIQFSLEHAATNPADVSVLLKNTHPAFVYITGGMTRVDDCEDQYEKCMKINRDAPVVIANAARLAEAKTVFFSTEYVFDGQSGPYSENDSVNPLSVYGKSKAEAEKAILDVAPDALIIRTTVVYGPETIGKNFAYTLVSSIRENRPFPVPIDQVSSPTYNRDLAFAAVRLAEEGACGIYHIAGSETMHRYAFALRLTAAARLDHNLICAVSTAELSQKALRPLNAGLKIDKLRTVLPDFHPRTVEEAVAHWIAHQRGKPWPG